MSPPKGRVQNGYQELQVVISRLFLVVIFATRGFYKAAYICLNGEPKKPKQTAVMDAVLRLVLVV